MVLENREDKIMKLHMYMIRESESTSSRSVDIALLLNDKDEVLHRKANTFSLRDFILGAKATGVDIEVVDHTETIFSLEPDMRVDVGDVFTLTI